MADKNRRQTRNMVVDPARQFKLIAFSVAIAFTLMAAQTGVFYYITNNVLKMLQGTGDINADANVILQNILGQMIVVFGLVFVVFAALIFWAAVYMSHRFFGPIVPIRRHLEKLKNGDFADKLQLRKGDYLQDIADDLNDLTEKLKEKN